MIFVGDSDEYCLDLPTTLLTLPKDCELPIRGLGIHPCASFLIDLYW